LTAERISYREQQELLDLPRGELLILSLINNFASTGSVEPVLFRYTGW